MTIQGIPMRAMNAPVEAPTTPPAPPETPAEPAEPQDSFAFRATRATVGTLAGIGGALVGSPVGAIKGAFSHDFVLGETAHRAIRGTASVAGLAAAVYAGSALGPIGIVAGLVAGPILGAVMGGAITGTIEGGTAALKGAIHEGSKFAHKASEVATHLVDKLAGKADRPETPPTPAAEPPAEQSPASPPPTTIQG